MSGKEIKAYIAKVDDIYYNVIVVNEKGVEIGYDDIEDDVIAINHLVRAKLKLSGTEFDQQITDVITKLQQRVDRRSMSIYKKPVEIF